MKTLLEIDFILHHGVTTKGVVANSEVTSDIDFDLDDTISVAIQSKGSGKVSFHNDHGQLEIVHYEKFIDDCKKPISFQQGRKRCDFLLTHENTNGSVLLLELTSATGDVSNLSKPIEENGKVIYCNGKFQKCEKQLASSLADLLAVNAIATEFNKYARKICLMAYKITPKSSLPIICSRPFERYLAVEARETKENGATISNPEIEKMGFKYCRIEHQYAFNL